MTFSLDAPVAVEDRQIHSSTRSVDFSCKSSHTGAPMDVRLAFLLMFLVMLASPVSAQSPCAECFNAVQEELKACLANAISVDDKNTCEENRDEQMKACKEKDCTVERESKESQKRNPPQER